MAHLLAFSKTKPRSHTSVNISKSFFNRNEISYTDRGRSRPVFESVKNNRRSGEHHNIDDINKSVFEMLEIGTCSFAMLSVLFDSSYEKAWASSLTSIELNMLLLS